MPRHILLFGTWTENDLGEFHAMINTSFALCCVVLGDAVRCCEVLGDAGRS